MGKNTNFTYKNLSPFKWFVLENFSFLEADFDALTEWQLFCKLGKEINKIINSTNLLGNQVEDLTNYVNNYFDNLNVQDEINNKLNEMAEDGTLQNIIAEYINLNSYIVFDTVNDMKNSENLINNMNIRTRGFHKINDFGGAYYHITNLTSENATLINDIDVINLKNNLIAILNPDSYINFEQLGAYGDDEHDDTIVLKYALENEKYNILPIQKTYKISDTINLSTKKFINFNSCILKAYNIENKIINYYEESSDFNFNNKNIGFDNLIIDCNNCNADGLFINSWYKNIKNIKIFNIAKIGINLNNGFENQFGTIKLYGNENNNNSIGLYINATDNQINDLYGIDLKDFIQINNNFIKIDNIHAWILHSQLSINSKMINFLRGSAKLKIGMLYIDTYHYGIYTTPDTTAQNYIEINNLFHLTHPTNFDFSTDARPIVFNQYNNGSTINHFINYLNIIANSSEQNVIFTTSRDTNQTPSWNGTILKRKISSNVNMANLSNNYGMNMSTVQRGLFSKIIENNLTKTGDIIEFNFVGKISNNFTNANTVIGNILSYMSPQNLINSFCEFTTGVYNSSDGNARLLGYLFISTTGEVTVDMPSDFTVPREDVYIKIHLMYHTNF